MDLKLSRVAESSVCAAAIHRRQLLSSRLELDCHQVQRDELGTHDCARHFLEIVNVIPLLLPQSLLTALNPRLVHRSSIGFKGITDASSDV